MTHPGAGPVTALATDAFLGDPRRFANGKALEVMWGSFRENIAVESSSGSVE